MLSARPLYAQVMGDAFDDLDEAVRRFHSQQGHVALRGWCRIEGPSSALGRWFACLARTPANTMETAFGFELMADEAREHWTRHFPGRRMRSTMRVDNGMLVERLGLTSFHFSLHAVDGALHMELERFSVLGVPCPRRLCPRIRAVETGRDGVFHFDVSAALPLLGRITAYTGHLAFPEPERTT